MKRWTDEEIEILKHNYATLSHEDLSYILFNRTWCAIKQKAQQLKLSLLTSPNQRFWKYVDKKIEKKCWNWIGLCHKGGYGLIKINKKYILAHRFSWVLHNGNITNKMCVLHMCDNPACVNPSHLFLGTQQDNIKDRDNKNRQFSKLTLNQAKQIRQLYREGKLKQREIAKLFNVSQYTISSIHRNKTWKYIK